MTQMYATDLDPRLRNDSFMGKGFEELLAKAEEEDKQFIIGEFLPNEEWFLE